MLPMNSSPGEQRKLAALLADIAPRWKEFERVAAHGTRDEADDKIARIAAAVVLGTLAAFMIEPPKGEADPRLPK